MIIINPKTVHCSIRRQFIVELEWRPESSYAAGSEIELRVSKLRTLAQWRLTSAEIEGADISWRWPRFPQTFSFFSNKTLCMLKAALPCGAVRGKAHRIILGLIPGVYAGVNMELSIWVNKSGPKPQGVEASPDPVPDSGSECIVEAVAGPVERLSVYSHPSAGKNGQVRTAIVPEDRYGNPGSFCSDVEAKVVWNGGAQCLQLRGPCVINLPRPKEIERCRVLLPLRGLDASENIANAVYHDGLAEVTGNPVWPGAMEGLMPTFGEFHWHSEFSGDGDRPYEAALAAGRDLMNMNFISSSDHNPKPNAWQRTVELLDKYNRDDFFATFYGWEDGSQHGHQNYYFIRPDHPAVCGGSAGIAKGGPNANSSKIADFNDLLAIPHHTNAEAETRRPDDDFPVWFPYQWTKPVAPIRLVEIMQVRGNQEADEYADAWRGWHQHHGASFQDALAHGYKAGVTGGTDNHCGWPGRIWSREEGGQTEAKSVILTGVWVGRIERGAVFSGLYARHTWAVWDTRAIVWFAVNGALMGSELSLAQGAALTAHFKITAESPLRSIEIVSEGRVIWQGASDAPDVERDIPLGEAARSTHFYLRVLERGGGIVYASPVFIAVL